MPAITLNDERQIVIDIGWLLGALTDEQKRELVDSLSCEAALIEDVTAQILDGWTERSIHGPVSCGAEVEPTTALSKARREVAMRAGEVAAKEIEDLKRALVWAKANEQRYSDAYFKAYHEWNNREWRGCPPLGEMPTANTSQYEVVKKETIPRHAHP